MVAVTGEGRGAVSALAVPAAAQRFIRRKCLRTAAGAPKVAAAGAGPVGSGVGGGVPIARLAATERIAAGAPR